MKKAQGLSMNVIIIAAIALLVLVIISVLVLRAGGGLNQGTSCQNIEGSRCETSCSDIDDGQTWINRGKICGNDEEVCCIPLGSQGGN